MSYNYKNEVCLAYFKMHYSNYKTDLVFYLFLIKIININ